MSEFYTNKFMDDGDLGENGNGCYYKILLYQDFTIGVVCVQWFDEYDYDHNRFYKTADGEDMCFFSKDKAKSFVNATFDREYINKDSRAEIPDDHHNPLFQGMYR